PGGALPHSLHAEAGNGVGVVVVILDHAATVVGLEVAAALLLVCDARPAGDLKLGVLLHLKNCTVVCRDRERFGDFCLQRHRGLSLACRSACLARVTPIVLVYHSERESPKATPRVG